MAKATWEGQVYADLPKHRTLTKNEREKLLEIWASRAATLDGGVGKPDPGGSRDEARRARTGPRDAWADSVERSRLLLRLSADGGFLNPTASLALGMLVPSTKSPLRISELLDAVFANDRELDGVVIKWWRARMGKSASANAIREKMSIFVDVRAELLDLDERAERAANRLLFAAGKLGAGTIEGLDEGHPGWRSARLTKTEIDRASASEDPTLVWASQVWSEHAATNIKSAAS